MTYSPTVFVCDSSQRTESRLSCTHTHAAEGGVEASISYEMNREARIWCETVRTVLSDDAARPDSHAAMLLF